MKMTLAEAFMLRNDLKKEIEDFKRPFETPDYLWRTKDFEKTYIDGYTYKPSTSYEAVLDRIQQLQRLNTAIEKANVENIDLLQEIQALGAKIAFLETIIQNIRRYPGSVAKERTYDSVKGVWEDIIVEYELLIDVDLVKKEYEKCKKRKRELEKHLQKNNFRIEIEF